MRAGIHNPLFVFLVKYSSFACIGSFFGGLTVTSLLALLRWLCCFSFLFVFCFSANGQDKIQTSDLLDRGISAMRNNNLDQALITFKKILLIEPTNAEAHFRIGEVYMTRRDAEEGLFYIQKSTELDPKNVRFSLNLASIYERQGKLEEALAEYQRVIDSGTKDKRIKEAEKRLTLASGKSLIQKGELNPALLIFNGLSLEYPDDPQVLFNIGAAYVMLNRIEEAEAALRKLVVIQPENALAHLNLATIYERTNRPQQALRHFRIIIEMNRPGGMTTSAKVREGIITGRLSFANRDWIGAITAFSGVLNIDSGEKEAMFNIALANLQLGNVDAAEQTFLNIIAADSEDYSARLNLGQMYADIGRVDQAIEQLQYVIDHDKTGRYRNQAKARMNFIHTALADKAMADGNVAESLRQYQNALNYFSGNVKASFKRGMIFVEQNKFDEARIEFENVVRADPNNLPGRLNLANIYERLNELTLAAEQYEFIIQINENSQEGQRAKRKWKITKARGYLTDQRLSDAEQLFKSILEEQADNLEAYYYLGIIQSSKGNLRGAANSYQSLLSYAPNNQRVRILLAKIYEQLQLLELAAQEYRNIIFAGANANIVDEAEVRLAIVESGLNGFSRNMSYQFAYDSNVNFNDLEPIDEVRSDLSFNIIYGLTLQKDLSVRLIAVPSYSTYHFGQFDYFSSNLQAIIHQGTPEESWDVQVGRQVQEALSTETSVSESLSASIIRQRKLFMKAVLGLSPPGLEGEDIATSVQSNFDVRSISSFNEPRLESILGGFGIAVSQNLKWGVFASVRYSLSAYRNVTNGRRVTTETLRTTDAITGQESVIDSDEIILYDSRDFERNTHSVSLSVSKTLSPGLRGTLGSSFSYTDYINIDSGARIRKEDKSRSNISLGLNTNLSYQFYKDFRFFASASITRNFSNLRTGTSQIQTEEESIATFQSTSLGDYSRFTVTTGVAMNF